MAVFPEYRNQGIGTELMKLAETQAIAKGLTKLSLIVFEQNIRAKRLYDRLGCREVTRKAIGSYPLIHYAGDAILMVNEIG